MKTRINSRAIALTMFLAVPSVAQFAVGPKRPSQFTKSDAAVAEAIDGVRVPAELASVARQSFVRPGMDVVVERFELPATTPRPAATGESHSAIAGYVEAAPEGLLDSATWQASQDGTRVYAAVLVSPDAKALRVRFSERFPAEMSLFVYDPETNRAFGPYSALDRDENGDWWSTIIFGDSIGLLFEMPAGTAPEARLPAITGVAYIHEPPPAATALLGSCTAADASCYPPWADEASSVTLMATIASNGNLATYCTGALLNRGPEDLSPLVMTANHCVGGNGGQAQANNTVFVWFFDTPTCNGTPPNPNFLPRSNGSLLLKRHTPTDWNLLGLYQPPAANWYLGWSSGYWEDDEPSYGIHHPGGTFKRMSFGIKTDETENTFCDANGQNCFDAEVWEIANFSGFTMPGSSGSPILDSSDRVRHAYRWGQFRLHGCAIRTI